MTSRVAIPVAVLMAFRVARETMVRMVGLEGYTQEETEEIRGIILAHTRAVVGKAEG